MDGPDLSTLTSTRRSLHDQSTGVPAAVVAFFTDGPSLTRDDGPPPRGR